MRSAWLLATLLTLPVLTGCIGDANEDPAIDPSAVLTPPPIPLDRVIEQGHDHADPSLHDFAWNVDRVGYHPGYADDEEPAGGFTELAVQLPYVYLCRGGGVPGVSVVDVSDPGEPSFVSHFQMPRCDDIEVSHDGSWVFASAQRNSPSELTMESDGPANLPRGTWVLDASDPSELTFESFYPMPYNGPHTIQYHRYDDGTEIVLHQLYDLFSRLDPTGQAPIPAPDGAVPVTQRIEVTQLTETATGETGLEAISVYSDTQRAVADAPGSVIPHDATVYTNPIDGHTYMLVAYWDAGVQIVQLDDPTEPQLVGTFEDFAPSALANIHQVRAFPELIDGKWVLVAEPEIVTADESGQITFIDASDPANPTKLGYWTLPGNVTIPEPFLFSPHNFDLDADGRVYLAHQHAGIWVIDVAGQGSFDEPASLGAILPQAPDGAAGSPSTWGVFLEDGLLYASDGPSGLHVLSYTGP